MTVKPTPPLQEMVRMRAVWQVPGMEAVRVRRDLAYKATDDGPLHMDVYLPPDPSAARPAVIMVHGGPSPRLGAKDMGVFLSYGEMLAASGLVAVTFNHRFLAPQRIGDAARDVADLVEHVRAAAGEWSIDPNRIALWAFSGGGPFLAAPLRDRPPWLRAAVAYYALLDLDQLPASDTVDVGRESRRLLSPIYSLGEDARSAPPILIARAGLDIDWFNRGIDRFVQTALGAGATLDLLNHPDGRHGFDILDDDSRSREIIRRTIGFLRDHLGA